ncbi:hypothetical protein ACWZHB_33070 [Nocardia sp. FBN12]|uniref:hypothetical protein n=1 Tax=Nocardia sp. FBN12 TaxID=3419766 RepID=UPI003D08783F
MNTGIDRAVHTTRARTGEGIDTDIELEFPIHERRTDTSSSDLSRDISTQFGDRTTNDFARSLAHG